MRRNFVALVAVAAALAVGPPAGADTIPQGGGANNVVVTQTTSDGFRIVRATTQVSQTGGISVMSTNLASATATGCTGCFLTAVAVQVVFFTPAQFVSPKNFAVVYNSCTACGTFAYARQYAYEVDRPFTLSADAQQQIQQLKQQISDTAASILPDSIADDLLLTAELDGLVAQMQDVIRADIAQSGVTLTAPPQVSVDTQQGF